MKRPRTSSILSRFLRERQGATAVEFAFIAFPFLLILFAIVELSLIFLATTGLDNATEAAGRQIRTGAFQQSAGATKDAFRDLVCGNLALLPGTCGETVFVDVRTFATFNDLASNFGQSGLTFNPASTCFQPGGARDIVLVRVYYMWPLMTPGYTAAFANTAGGKKRMLTSIAVFRNEPNDANPPVGAGC